MSRFPLALAGFLFLLMLYGTDIHAQRMGLEAGAGLQKPRMEDMKYLQDVILDAYPLEGKIISSFPAYLSTSFGMRRQVYPAVHVGGAYSYSATGARINYTDYSGSLSTDMRAASHRIGALVSYALLGEHTFVLKAIARADLNISLIDISTVWLLTNFIDSNQYKYRSFSPSLSGGLEAFINLETISFGLEAAYMADVPGGLVQREDDDPLFDPNDSERQLTSDWTGWRAQFKIILWL